MDQDRFKTGDIYLFNFQTQLLSSLEGLKQINSSLTEASSKIEREQENLNEKLASTEESNRKFSEQLVKVLSNY